MVILDSLNRNRNFTLLWVGGAVSAVGYRATAMAFPLLVLATGGSASDAGLVGAAAMAPHLLFQLIAGALVDRWNRRTVLIATDAGRALAIGSVAVAVLAGTPSLNHLVLAAFAEGTFSVFHVLAQRAAVRTVVPDHQLGDALSRNEVAARGANLGGQPLSGVLFAVGRGVPFLSGLVSYLVSLATVVLLRGEFQVRAGVRQHVLTEVRQGFNWLWHQPFLRAATMAISAGNMLLHALYLAVIVVVSRAGYSSIVVGLVLAGTGVGGVAGALIAPWIARQASMRRIFVTAHWLWAAIIPMVAIFDHPLASAGVFALFAFAGAVYNVVVGAYQMRITPPHLLARVSSIIGMLSFGVIPLGTVVGGYLLDHYGGGTTVGVLSAVMIIIATAVTLAPSVRLADVEPAAEPVPTREPVGAGAG